MMQDDVLYEELCYLNGTVFEQGPCLGLTSEVANSFGYSFVWRIGRQEQPL